MNRSLVSLLSLGFLSLSAAVSCGSDDKKDPYATASDFCAAWSERACITDVVRNCSQEDEPAKSACRSAQKSFCMDFLEDQDYHRAPVEQCLEFVERAYSDAQINAAEASVVLRFGAPCAQVIGQGGDLCDSDKDCDDNGVCEDNDAGVGVCRIAGGYECDPEGELQCASRFYCKDSACVQRSSAGDTCETDGECESDQLCEITVIEADPEADPPVEESTTGACVSKAGVGDDCEEDRECETGWCQDGQCTQKVVLTPQASICEDLS